MTDGTRTEALERIENFVSLYSVNAYLNSLQPGPDEQVPGLMEEQNRRAQFVVDAAGEVLTLKARQTALEQERLQLESRLAVIAIDSKIIGDRLRSMKIGQESDPDETTIRLDRLIEAENEVEFFGLLPDLPAFTYYIGPNEVGVPPFNKSNHKFYSARVDDRFDSCMLLLGRANNTLIRMSGGYMPAQGCEFYYSEEETNLPSRVDVSSPTIFMKDMIKVPHIGLQALKALLVGAHVQAEYLAEQAEA